MTSGVSMVLTCWLWIVHLPNVLKWRASQRVDRCTSALRGFPTSDCPHPTTCGSQPPSLPLIHSKSRYRYAPVSVILAVVIVAGSNRPAWGCLSVLHELIAPLPLTETSTHASILGPYTGYWALFRQRAQVDCTPILMLIPSLGNHILSTHWVPLTLPTPHPSSLTPSANRQQSLIRISTDALLLLAVLFG